MMKIQAVVPIKLNNERFPNKNLAPLHGKPLCRYLLETLSGMPELNTTVYCSDEKIASYLPEGVGFFKRSAELDRFSVQRQEIVLSMLRDIYADIYVYAHVTNPFLSARTIREAVEAVAAGGYDTALGVTEHRTYAWYQGRPVNFDRNDLKRSQDIDPLYLEMGLFVFKRPVAEQNGSVYGERIKFLPVSDFEAVDINYPEDMAFAERMLERMERGL